MRRLAGDDPEVNEEWICDKGRFAFQYAKSGDRFVRPMVRENGQLRNASWTEALRVAADGLAAARDARGAAVLPGGRLTLEDAYAYAKFARVSLRTNDVDFRARPHSDEELHFLASTVVGVGPDSGAVTYTDLEAAPSVLCVAFEPEEESPIVFLRLRKAARNGGTKVFHLGQWNSPGVEKTTDLIGPGSPIHAGGLLRCPPGGEAAALAELPSDVDGALRGTGSVLLVGERAASVPGLLSEVLRLSARTGARVAWIPRRAGERGAIEAGALPALLPGGRPVADAPAREAVEQAWGLASGSLPTRPGRDLSGILRAAADGELSGLLVGGVDPDDLPDPQLADRALQRADFVVSLELRPTAATEHADVVLPIAPSVESSGTYLDWEGRRREFTKTIEGTSSVPDCRVLDTLAVEMDTDLFTQTPQATAAELARLGAHSGPRTQPPDEPARWAHQPGPGEALLATWRQLLDNGSLQDGDPNLAGTARPPVAVVSPATAAKLGFEAGQRVEVSTDRGAVALPTRITEMPDDVVWLPTDSGPSQVPRQLGAEHGSRVRIRPAPAAPSAEGADRGSATGAGRGRNGSADGSGA
jgi:NADH-quinone oxidoreductase subunit G